MSGALVRSPDSTDLKRFGIGWSFNSNEADLVEVADGECVRYEDHLAAIASLKREHEQQLAALQADAERWRFVRSQPADAAITVECSDPQRSEFWHLFEAQADEVVDVAIADAARAGTP
jgi:hypothetical protein